MAKKTIKYAAAVKELEEILQKLESDQIDVDEVSEKVKRALELITLCREKIETTEIEIKKIVSDFDNKANKAK